MKESLGSNPCLAALLCCHFVVIHVQGLLRIVADGREYRAMYRRDHDPLFNEDLVGYCSFKAAEVRFTKKKSSLLLGQTIPGTVGGTCNLFHIARGFQPEALAFHGISQRLRRRLGFGMLGLEWRPLVLGLGLAPAQVVVVSS